MEQLKKQTLYNRESNSDKQYTLWIEPRDGGFMVQAQWGPRGGAVQSGAKTPQPVPMEKAQAVYDKTVKEKLAKGYHPGDTDATELGEEPYIRDDAWAAQEKMNGKRIMLRVRPGSPIAGVNRRGLKCPIPKEVQAALVGCPECDLDGELVGDVYHAFDVIEEGVPLSQRVRDLSELARCSIGKHFKIVDMVMGARDKAVLCANLRAQRREGIVFKRLDGLYTPGRVENLKKTTAVKVKFYAEASLLIRRSASSSLKLEGKEEE